MCPVDNVSQVCPVDNVSQVLDVHNGGYEGGGMCTTVGMRDVHNGEQCGRDVHNGEQCGRDAQRRAEELGENVQQSRTESTVAQGLSELSTPVSLLG